MNTKNNELPEEIIKQIQTRAYASLNTSEQIEVSKWFTPSEYESMHAFFNQAQQANNSKQQKKKALLLAFDQKHSSSKRTLAIPLYMRWTAAAVVVLLIAVSVIFQPFQTSELRVDHFVTDTVYLSSTPAVEKITIRDTLFIETPNANYRPNSKDYVNVTPTHSTPQQITIVPQDNSLSWDAIEQKTQQNRKQGARKKELSQPFEVVVL